MKAGEQPLPVLINGQVAIALAAESLRKLAQSTGESLSTIQSIRAELAEARKELEALKKEIEKDAS